MNAGTLFERFLQQLPFVFTQEQKEAVKLLHKDAGHPQRMHRLLQGDVGSGKTVAAFSACLPAINEDFQVAWLAPTEVLARQTFSVLLPWCMALGISLELLTGSVAPDKKKQIVKRCANGAIAFAVGTHALLQSGVTFKKLGMIVIDEQHKFGAQQRAALQEKDPLADVLLLSATPIPQSLAQTLYGDLDIVSIRSVPGNRKKVNTHIVPEHKRADMLQFVIREIAARTTQVFYVVPRIGNPDEEDADGVQCAEHVYKELKNGAFALHSCSLVHGRTPNEEQEQIMDMFKSGSIDVLVSTTIVEVGIDVPNASIMIIENAERFGLSQLHQLRGRVGRGSAQSYCFLLAGITENELARERLEYFCGHNDGFDIAEKDLQLRGPGEVIGWKQTGRDGLVLADIIRDAAIFKDILGELKAVEEKTALHIK
jgi:ATP-dependent DNA helicase RecG